MSVIDAAILGLVQGLAEFLPISSSGHLRVAQHFLGVNLGEDVVAFEILLHVATLLAVLVYFADDLKRILGPWLRSVPRLRGGWGALEPPARVGWLIVLTVIPTAAVGFVAKDFLEGLAANLTVVAVMLLLTGCLDFYADRRAVAAESGGALEGLSPGRALLCGLAQSVALIHGISRSGTTMAAGFAAGLSREQSPRFAFLMAIPAICGAAVLDLPKLADGVGVGFVAAAIGFVVAAVSGYAALVILFRLVRRGRLRVFAWYCWALGALVLTLLAMGF